MKRLYHASTDKHLTVIKPHRTLSGSAYIGDYVFATANKAYAAMYLTPKGRQSLLNVFDGKSYLVVNDTPERFIADDKGGAIYEVPPETFIDTPQVELAETEVVSPVAVVPLRVKLYATSLEALHAYKIPLYFVDRKQMERIQTAPDHGWRILQKLKPYMNS